MPPKKKSAPSARKTSSKPPKRRVRVRTYRQGLGDCHLVSFTRPDGTFFHLLIDCGVVDVTPEPEKLMTRVAQDIAKEITQPGNSRPTLDVVVATHQHTDHLSGFRQAQATFAGIKMKRLWLAWTEDRANPLGRQIKGELVRIQKAVRRAAARLAGVDDEAAQKVQGVLDFFGVAGDKTQAVLDDLEARPGIDVRYHQPGSTFLLPEVPNVRVYVLGPPENAASMKITNPRRSKGEGYEATSLAAGMDGFINALAAGQEGEADAIDLPFEARCGQSAEAASKTLYFRNRYGFSKTDLGEEWRRIDTAWLQGAETLALALNSYTNNTSLALAFEFVDTGEVLLFPGDAQVGSWLSWQKITWRVTEATGAKRRVKVNELFARTVFYKASHHASHNGTLSAQGLELMTHRDLVAFVPVDKAMSIKKHWDRTLPWQPLLGRLKEVTRGRLILTDTAEKPPDAAQLPDLSVAERGRFARQVQVTPLFVDYTL